MVKKMKKRICLVLDCLCAHDLSDKTADLINLQHYVIKEKRLSERETVVIFYDVVRVVEALHQVTPCPAACPFSSARRVLGPSDREASRSPCRRRPPLLLLLSESSSGPPCRPSPPAGCALQNIQAESGRMTCAPSGAQGCRPQPVFLGTCCPGSLAENSMATPRLLRGRPVVSRRR